MSAIIKQRKKQDKYTLSKSDIEFYRMAGVFGLVCIFVLLVMNMKNSLTERIAGGNNLTYNFYMFCRTPIFWILGAVMVGGVLGWYVYNRVKKIDESKRIFTSANCLVLVAYLIFFSLCFGVRYPSSVHTSFIAATICLALLYYISKFYGMDFVAYSVITAVISMTVSTVAMVFDPYAIVIKVAAIVAMLAVCLHVNKKIAALKVSKQKKASFLKFPMYIPVALGICFLFWAATPLQSVMLLNRNIMLMLMLLQYVVFAIIYTIRLIKD